MSLLNSRGEEGETSRGTELLIALGLGLGADEAEGILPLLPLLQFSLLIFFHLVKLLGEEPVLLLTLLLLFEHTLPLCQRIFLLAFVRLFYDTHSFRHKNALERVFFSM